MRGDGHHRDTEEAKSLSFKSFSGKCQLENKYEKPVLTKQPAKRLIQKKMLIYMTGRKSRVTTMAKTMKMIMQMMMATLADYDGSSNNYDVVIQDIGSPSEEEDEGEEGANDGIVRRLD